MSEPMHRCGAELHEFSCGRRKGHDGSHQAEAFVEDGEYNLQLVEWWSINPNGEPVEAEHE